jgi:hypothetical protein
MKRKTTITLTIAGLVGLAGMLYATNHDFFGGGQEPALHSAGPTVEPAAPAATHFFFSGVHNPDPSPNQAGPIGVAAAPADLIASEYCDFSGFTIIDKVDCTGGFAPIALIPTPGGGGCEELYMTIAPNQSTNAGFTPRDYFITDGAKIYQLRLPNSPTLFAIIPDAGCAPDHTGITFDKEGTFNNDLLVTCKFSGGVWAVDGSGTVTNVGNFHSAGQIGEIENPAVVPRGFGPFGGQLWVSDEEYPNTVSTIPGALHAMDSGGNATLDVVEWQDAEGVLVIPQNLCTFCQNNGTLFQAITLNELGPYGIYQYFPVDFTGLGGDVLIPSEGGAGTALVQFDGTNYVTSFFDSIPGGTFEGASFVDCDVPTPTPTSTPTATFTPTATSTATFTPTATATFTPTATATFTPTATATFTPTATATFTPTATATFTPTATATFTPTATATFTPTATATFTPTPTATSTPTPTPTPSATPMQVSQITPTGTTCSQFRGGTAQTLSSINYSVSGGTIHNVNPGVFFYWVRVTVPAGNNTLTITQTITTGNFNTFFGVAAGSSVFDSNCNTVGSTITQNGNTTTVTFTASAAGTYIIGIKYNPHTVVGAPAPSPTTVHYNFATTGVPGSTSGIDLIKQ